MKRSKMIVIPLFATAAIVGMGALSPSQAQAFDGFGNGFQSLIEKIAQKFNLDSGEVKNVFEENRNEWQSQKQQRFEARLEQTVSEGKITEEQKKVILEKRQELMDQREKNRNDHQNLSLEERKKQRQTHQNELNQWAKDNGIDLKYMFGAGKGMKGKWGNN